MSITETGVVALCRAAERIFDLEKGINETAPGVIKAGITFLHKNVGFHTVKNQHYVSLIEELRKVRNCITHSGGSLRGRKDADDIRSFITGIPTVEIDSLIVLLSTEKTALLKSNGTGNSGDIIKFMDFTRRQRLGSKLHYV